MEFKLECRAQIEHVVIKTAEHFMPKEFKILVADSEAGYMQWIVAAEQSCTKEFFQV